MRNVVFMSMVSLVLMLSQTASVAGGYQMPVTFAGYTNRTDVLTNFPVLVVLSNNVGNSGFNFATHQFLSTNGWDLRFKTNLNDTGAATLNYEIESWSTNVTATNYVWVQVPALVTGGTGAIWATWGNSSDSNQLACTTNGAVWDSNFNGVWHLGDAGPTYASDSTANTNRGAKSGGVTFGGAGQVGGAASFDGVNGYINAGPVHAGSAANGLTLSTWVYTSFGDFDGTCRVIAADNNGDPNTYNGFFLVLDDRGSANPIDGLLISFDTVVSSVRATKVSSVIGATPAWYHLVSSYNPSAGLSYLYINGVAVATTVNTAGTGNYIPDNNTVLCLGSLDDGTSTLKGMMDECRVSKIVRSADWSFAEWLNMASNLTFNKYGTVSGGGGSAPAITASPANASVVVGSAANFSVTADGAAPLFYQWRTNGMDIADATNSSYMTQATTMSDNGKQFTVIVTNIYGSATSGVATLTVIAANDAPTVQTAASANPATVTGATTELSVLGADDGGAENLTYTWTTNGAAPAALLFSVNGNNAATNTTATFTKAGTYNLQVTIRDVGNQAVTSSVSVTVNQTLTTIAVTPASASVITNATQQFTAGGSDQFGVAMSVSPFWSVNGGGSINSGSGLFTAGGTDGGPHTVTATSGGVTGTASLTVCVQRPVQINTLNFMKDANGQIIHDCVEPHISKFGNTWYAYGFSCRTSSTWSTTCYASTNFATWTRQYSQPWGSGGSDMLYLWCLYNAKNTNYVFYSQVYGAATLDVYTSPTPTGPFTYHNTTTSAYGNIGDLTFFQDTDNKAYLIYNKYQGTIPTRYTYIYQLNDDYHDILPGTLHNTETVMEGLWMVKHNGNYFLFGSPLVTYDVDDDFYLTAPTPMGPWTYQGLFAPSGSKTFSSQVFQGMDISGSKGQMLVYIGHRWNALAPVNGVFPNADTIWLPLLFSSDTTVHPMTYFDNWYLDLQGTGYLPLAVTPTSAIVTTNSTQAFVATVYDLLGVALTNQPAINWSVTGGGSIDSSGLFTAGSTSVGSYNVIASGGGLCATASVMVVDPSLYVVASGGSATNEIEGYRMHTFTSNGTFSVTTGGCIEVLVVAGGGGGGSNGGGGGGGGGVIHAMSCVVTNNQLISVIVGAGGAPHPNDSSVPTTGGNSVFGTLTALGGGGGSSRDDGASAASGGSGGGGSGCNGGSRDVAGNGTTGQGNNGANGTASDLGVNASGGGGGGAGGAGTTGVSQQAGDGGTGLQFANFAAGGGSPAGWFAGGGAGGKVVNGNNGLGGTNGGGGNAGMAGGTNTGGGGGGGYGGTPYLGGATGGSGIVIVRYALVSSDANTNGMPDAWEVTNFGSTTNVNGGANDDWDNDGMKNLAEYIAGTSPTNASSVFSVSAIGGPASGGQGTNLVLQWSSVAGKWYAIQTATNLMVGFDGVEKSNILATPVMNVYTVNVDQIRSRYYRVTVEP